MGGFLNFALLFLTLASLKIALAAQNSHVNKEKEMSKLDAHSENGVKILGVGDKKIKDMSSKDKLKLSSGTVVTAGDYPFLVTIYSNLPAAGLAYVCGGSIISRNWILTSASCFQSSQFPTDYSVILGEIDTASLLTNSIYGVSRIITHHLVNSSFFGANDIALLRVDSPMLFRDNVQPIRLPHPLYIPTGSAVAIGIDNSVAGSTFLASASVRIQPLALCGVLNGHVGGGLICGGASGGRSSCGADWGYPLVVVSRGAYVIVGITPIVTPADCTAPAASLYTSVASYRMWIFFHTGI